MKRVASFAIMLAMLLGLLPAANAAGMEPIQAADLYVTWYSDWDVLSRLYGTDRMILVKDNLCALYGLDGTKYTDPVFDAIGEYDDQGYAVAMKNGKWGKIDRNGNTVTDFVYDTQEEARDEVGVKFVSKRPEEPPYALAKLDGTLLTGYDFWAWRPFVNGFSFVTDGTDGWGFIDTAGRAVTEQKYIGLIMNDAKMGGGDFGEDGYAIVYYKIGYDSVYNIIDTEGQELLPEPIGTKPWRAGLGLWGYVDNETGKVGFCDGTDAVVIAPQFEYRLDPKGYRKGNRFDETTGVAEVYQGNEPIFIDVRGNRVEEREAPDGKRDLHEGLVWVDARGNDVGSGYNYGVPWGFQNEKGELVIPCIYDTVGHFDHGYATVTVDGVYGLLKNPLNKKTEEPEENKPETPAPTFTDVPAGSWFEEGIMTCARNGIMVGTGEDTFSPNATLTEAECVMLAYRIYDRAHGGDGSVMERPEKYRYIKLVTDDGLFTHEGDGGDRSKWDWGHPTFGGGGWYLYPKNTGPIPGLSIENNVAAAVTIDGVSYKGHLEEFYQGHMRPTILAFVAETREENDLVADAAMTTEVGYWWSDLGYTLEERGLYNSVFPGYYLDDHEAGRYVFANLLGTVTDLPKKFDVPSIPDGGDDHLYKLYEAGIIGGVDAYGTFDAEKTLTRAEAAVMVARILDESQRLTTPPKAMPKEGEGYTLTYLRNGIVDSGFEQDTYPYYFVAEPITDPDSWEQSRRVGFLKLDGSFLPWPESDLPYTLERFGGNTIYWTNIYKAETDEELDRYEVGVLNDDLEWIIKPQYAELWPRKGGYAAVSQEDRYLLLDEKGNVEGEVASRQELPERPYWSGYYEYWADWQNWGGLSPLPDGTYYRWPDGSPATEWFDWCGRIGPDGRGFVQKDGKIYRIEFTSPKT